MKQDKGRLDPGGLLHLSVVYVVWSSTYLAIRFAVREGAGFPPFTLGLMRAALGGAVLLAWSWLRRKNIRPKREELIVLAASGLLLWVGGNGLVTFAEQRTDSGLAALMVAAAPIWAALIEAVIDRRWPSSQFAVALVLGFSGITILTIPNLSSGQRADSIAMLALVVATITWSAGSVLQARKPVELAPQVSAAYQMFFGAAGFALVALLLNEPRPTPTTEAWLAWGYLVLFGSIFAFSSYVTALSKLPTRIVMTYAYVTPVLAVYLGWLILNEAVTSSTIIGSVLVLIGVAGVFRERRIPKGSNETSGD